MSVRDWWYGWRATLSPWHDNRRVGIHRWLRDLYFFSQRETAIRYQPVLHRLMPDTTILEIGCGPLGLSQFISHSIVGVDVAEGGAIYENLNRVRADARALPFADRAFHTVVCVDTLEHVEPRLRARLVAEALRVTEAQLLVAVPCGEAANRFEDRVRELYRSALSRVDDPRRRRRIEARGAYLEEHDQCGLPTRDEARRWFREASVDARALIEEENESSIVWYHAAIADLRVGRLRWFLTTVVLLLFFPILRRVRWGGNYRAFFIVDKRRSPQS